ncbi:MAG: sulfatase-like hydrolase/transferase [Verrucomicrobiota bacterium]
MNAIRNEKKILIRMILIFVHTSVVWTKIDAQTIKPNFVIFYADDLGWQDTNITNEGDPSPWVTPNIDALASTGINFKQGYSPAPTCAPSRISMLSGKHVARTGVTHVKGGSPTMYNNIVNTLIKPYYGGRMETSEYTLAEALQDGGYYTGHVGKWHCAVDHHAHPGADTQGFEYSSNALGVTSVMQPNRMSAFASYEETDEYKLTIPSGDIDPYNIANLDESILERGGRPTDQTTEKALEFLASSVDSLNEDRPFFLYLAHYMVHEPIHTRDEALLQYYCAKLGIDYTDFKDQYLNAINNGVAGEYFDSEGKYIIPDVENPFYGAMVDTLDWSLGKIIDFLTATDDPRNPGYKLIDTTYIVFSSDNGGFEGAPNKEIITDNYPLDKGKISTREGGVRVPFIISGPGISPSISHEIISQLDLYPTFLELSGLPGKDRQNQFFDGIDVSGYLLGLDSKIRNEDGSIRDTLFWHFPNGSQSEMRSCLRKGDYKLYKNYIDETYSLFQLYDGVDGNGVPINKDIEEAFDLVNDANFDNIESILVSELNTFLADQGMIAQPAYWNPYTDKNLANKELTPNFTGVEAYDSATNIMTAEFETEGKALVVKGYLDYTLNGGAEYEEWFQIPATVIENKLSVSVPNGTTHYAFNLVDENNFLRSSIEFEINQTPYSAQASTFNQSRIADPLYFIPGRAMSSSTIALWSMNSSDFAQGGSLEVIAGDLSGYSDAGFMGGGGASVFSSDSSAPGRIRVKGSQVINTYFPSDPDPSLTVEAWVKFSSINTPNDQYIVDKYNAVGGYRILLEDNSDRISVAFLNDAASGPARHVNVSTSETGIQTKQWYHIAFSWDGSANVVDIYLDGDQILSEAIPALDVIKDSSSYMTFGNKTSGGYPLDGFIDEVRIGDIANVFTARPELPNVYDLSDVNTLAYYQLGSDEEGSESGELELITTGVETVSFSSGIGFEGNSLYLSPTNTDEDDRLIVVGSENAGIGFPSGQDPDISTEVWVRFDDVESLNDQMIFNNIGATGGFQLKLLPRYQVIDGIQEDMGTRLLGQFRGEGVGGFANITSDDLGLKTGEWYHLAINWNGSENTLELFLDYTTAATAASAQVDVIQPSPNPITFGNAAFLGATNQFAAPFSGLIDGFRIRSNNPNYSENYGTELKGYALWQQDTFDTNAISLGHANRYADPDGDGIVNIDEYIFGTDPSTHSNQEVTRATVIIDGVSYQEIQYNRTTSDDVIFAYSLSTDGVNWTTLEENADLIHAQNSPSDNLNGSETVTLLYEDPDGLGSDYLFDISAWF